MAELSRASREENASFAGQSEALYPVLYIRRVGATRTQIYLTAEQRQALDAIGRGAGLSLAEMIRHAVDQYLGESPDFGPALDATFGTLPTLRLKGRGEMATDEHTISSS